MAQVYVPHIHIKLGLYLTNGLDYAVAEAEGPEEIFRILLEFSDNIPDKVDLLDNCGAGFLMSFLGNKNQKEDIDNCILAYDSALHLTPQGHPDMSRRMNILGASYYHRFNLTGDPSNISKAILYQQKALDLTPEGHADMPTNLNDLGLSFLSRFECTGNFSDISDAISYQQKAHHLTPEGHPDLPMYLNNIGYSFRHRFECTGDLADIFDAISYKDRKSVV